MTPAATRCDLAKHSVGVYTQIMRASDRAYARLREEIIDGALEPGTVLGEVEQSARLGISRTPLREALARLVADGLAETSRGRGLLVTAMSLAEAPRLFDLRIALETLAARRAAERLCGLGDASENDTEHDPEGGPALRSRFTALAEQFEEAVPHLSAGTDPSGYYALTVDLDVALDAACGNSYLAEALRGLRLHLGRLRRLARNSPGRLADSAREHAAISRAIAVGDPDLAAAATTVHLHHALAHLQGSGSGLPDTGTGTGTGTDHPTPPPTSQESAS